VLGVGGGGCRAVDKVVGGVGGPTIAAVNTDSRSLAESKAGTKIQIGISDAEGFGTGGDVDLGKLSAEHDIEMIRGMFSDADVAVIVTCLGGGTGSGATPVVLKAARDAQVFTIVMATYPFGFEGEKRKAVADRAKDSLVALADVVCLIENDSLFDAAGGKDLKESFKKADMALAAGICSLWQILVQPAFIGIDLADLRALVSHSGGACQFGFGDARGVNRGASAVESMMNGAVFDKGRALRASGSALVCVAGSHDLTLAEVGDVLSAISRETPDGCNLIMGAVINDEWIDRLMISVFLTDSKKVVSSKPVSTTGTVPAVKGRRKRNRTMQNKLNFNASGKGRFKDVEATILDGKDLDIPTYVRLGIKLDV
jgi:cell division protein FtsZ